MLKKKQKGVAILMVLVSLALLSAIVTEVSTKETIKYKLAINGRDALAAEALAESAVNFAQLILMVQEPIQSYIANFAKAGVQMPSYTMWNLFSLDSDLLKGLTKGAEVEIGEKKEKEKEKEEKTALDETKSKNINLFGAYQAPESGYGAFRGSFKVDNITDEESKFSIRKWISPNILPKEKKRIADQIESLLSNPKYKNLFKEIGPKQLIGNIYDYFSEGEMAVDVTSAPENWGREGRVLKKQFYANTPDILPKRAKADSIAELRLIPGMSDALYQVLEKNLSIYSESESVNILSLSDEVLGVLFYSCVKNREAQFSSPEFLENLLNNWNKKKSEGQIKLSMDGIIGYLQENNLEVDKEECSKLGGVESKNFTIKGMATVGNVTKTLIVKLRCSGATSIVYQFQYL